MKRKTPTKKLKARQAQASSWRRLAQEGFRLSKPFARPRNQEDAESFGSLYRRSTSELARARAFSPNRRQLEYLEQAVGSAHFAVYRKSAPRAQSIWKGLIFGFPALIRQYAHYHLLAIAITALAACVAYFAVINDPAAYYLFVDSSLAGERNPAASRETLEAALSSGRDSSAGELASFSSHLFQHNTRISFLCFALGVFIGLPTIYLLITNGLMLGAFIALYARVGLTVDIIAWLFPHGVPEIGAIILCGGAGMALGHGILHLRGKNLRERACDSAMTVITCVPLLFLAALIEGFFRQSDASIDMRYTMIGVLFTALMIWILFVRGKWQNSSWSRTKSGFDMFPS